MRMMPVKNTIYYPFGAVDFGMRSGGILLSKMISIPLRELHLTTKPKTPGLGAEIKDNPRFRRQFAGKKIYNDLGEFVSVAD